MTFSFRPDKQIWANNVDPDRGGGGVGVYSNLKVVYMCHREFKNRGLKEQSLTENGGLSELTYM